MPMFMLAACVGTLMHAARANVANWPQKKSRIKPAPMSVAGLCRDRMRIRGVGRRFGGLFSLSAGTAVMAETFAEPLTAGRGLPGGKSLSFASPKET
jgi:hypothetical protein